MIETAVAPEVPSRNTRRYAILGVLFGLMFPVIATAVHLAAAGLQGSPTNVLSVQAQPLMWIIDTAPIFLGAFAAFAGRRQDSLEAGNVLLAQQSRELRGTQLALQKRVEERTVELEQRDQQTRNAVRITRRFAQIHDAQELAATAVDLIAQDLPGFAVDLYQIDERRSEVARSASSKGPDAPSVTVKLGDPSLVGQVAASAETGRLASGTLGPELALPLISRGRTLGVLHLRAENEGAHLPADTDVFQLLADQLASAIETSRLVNEARDALQQLQAASGQSTQAAWRERDPASTLAYEFTPAGVRPGRPDSTSADPRSLRVPLELRGQRIGTIAVTRPGSEGWTEADRDLAQKTATQVALALENVRLLEETRDRALQEQRLSELSARLGQSVDLDTLLQTAVRELATLPEVTEASIYLSPSTSASEKGPS